MLSKCSSLALLAGLTAAQNVTYDYVIAGAGTAGMLLAAVLTENPDVTVAVLEAGGDGRTDRNITDPERRGMAVLATSSSALTEQAPSKIPNTTGSLKPFHSRDCLTMVPRVLSPCLGAKSWAVPAR